jgi:hypothetical protein
MRAESLGKMSKPTESMEKQFGGTDGATQIFRPYERLVQIKILGKPFEVPERNTILRCFQYLSPETIPYGRFCWNQDCQYCRVVGKLTDDEQAHELLSCKFMVSAGMEITELSPELKLCLQNKIGRSGG